MPIHTNQQNRPISIENWSDPVKFRVREPMVTGYDLYSDSLSSQFNGTPFFEANGEYFAIDTWADYYYWFTQKYDSLFWNPVVEYEVYYLTGNDFGMARFVYWNGNYKADRFPAAVRINFAKAQMAEKPKKIDFFPNEGRSIERRTKTSSGRAKSGENSSAKADQ